MRALIVLVMLLTLWSSQSTCFAQGIAKSRQDLQVDENQFRDVAGDLRCPTCTGLSVLDSDASFSIQIKNEVKEQIVAGKSKDEILKFFTDRYGPWILRAPPREGVHLFAWLVPILVLILGPILICLTVWSRRRQVDHDEVTTRSVEDIVSEMQHKLDALRQAKGGQS